MSSESAKKTISVALGVCLVCSVLVSSATVALSKKQAQNKLEDKIENILIAADLYSDGIDIEKVYEENIKPEIIDLKTGEPISEKEYTSELNPHDFDIKKIKDDPRYSEKIPEDKDIARIKTKPKYMIVYRVMKNDSVSKYILPIYGKGLWSTLYGFIALDKDLRTVTGITFYEHGETPGLGGEVDNPRWKRIWKGKKAFDENWNLKIAVIKGKVDKSSPLAKYEIDGLSGATMTTRGVDKLVKFWLGKDGYGTFFKKLRERGKNNGQV